MSYEDREDFRGLKLLLWIAVFLLGLFLGRKEYRQGGTVIEYKTDTLVVVDTLLLEKPKLVTVTKIVKDTVLLPVIEAHTDSVYVEVPIESRYAQYTDADIWYHGFNADIDSVKVFPKTVYIDRPYEVISKKKDSKWVVTASGGYAATTSGLTPYIGIGIGYKILGF